MSVCVYLLIVRTLEDYPFRAKGYSNKPINQLYTPTHNILVMLKPWSNKCQGRHSVARIGLWTLVRYLGLCSLCFLRQLRALCSSQFCNSFRRDHGVHGLNLLNVLSIKNACTVAPGPARRASEKGHDCQQNQHLTGCDKRNIFYTKPTGIRWVVTEKTSDPHKERNRYPN